MLQITLKNNIRIRGAGTPLRAEVTKALTVDNPEAARRKKQGRTTWGVEEKLKLYLYDRGDLIVPRGFSKDLEAILKAQGVNPAKVITVVQNEGQPVDFGPWNEDYKLKKDQAPMVKALVAENGVGVAPAGSGKTIMGMRYIYEVGRPTLWLTHTKDLMYQSKERAEATLKGVGQVGLLGDGKTEWGSGKLIIATVQTIQQNPQLIEALDQFIGVVIIDEAHHFPAPQFIDVAAKFSAARILGLTATPDRKDQLQIYMYMGIGPKLYEISRDGLYDSGRLVKPELRFIYTKFDYEQASDRQGSNVDAGGEDLDYVDLMNTLINDEDRAQLLAHHILDAAPLGASIVIAESVRYCFTLRDAVAALAKRKWGVVPRQAVVHGGLSRYSWKVAGNEAQAQAMVRAGEALEYKYDKRARRFKVKVPQYTEAEFNDWQVTNKQRKAILDDVREGRVDILYATQLAREGLDISHLTVGHMATPKRGDTGNSRSGAAVEQEIGRIMRPDPGNPDKRAVWYDYVDYEVGVLKSQYHSRRKTYRRLDLIVPNKPPRSAEADLIDSFLGGSII